jgi:hypothetical protein
MGEAKRRNQLGRQAADAIRRRVAAGEFGPNADAYVLVLDRSPAVRELLGLLAADGVLAKLAPLTEAEPLRLWEASTLFRYALLCGGQGSAERRSLLAVDLGRLIGEALPRALARVRADTGRAPGVLLAIDEADRAVVERALAGAKP